MAVQRVNVAVDQANGDITVVAAPGAANKIIVLGMIDGGSAAGGYFIKSGSTPIFGSSTAPVQSSTLAWGVAWGEGGIPLLECAAGEALILNSTAAHDIAILIFFDVVKA